MKTKISLPSLFVSLFTLINLNTNAQNINEDTILVNQYLDLADKYTEKYTYDAEDSNLLDSIVHYLDKAKPLIIQYFGIRSSRYANLNNLYGTVSYYRGNYNEALIYLQKSYDILSSTSNPNQKDLAMYIRDIGLIYLFKGEYNKSLIYLQKALEMKLQNLDKNDRTIGYTYDDIGKVYDYKEDFDKALEYLQKALQIHITNNGEKNSEVGTTYNNMGFVYYDKGEYNKALDCFLKDLQFTSDFSGKESPKLIGTYRNLGMVYSKTGEYDKALEFCNKALKIQTEQLDTKHPLLGNIYDIVGRAYEGKGEYEKALLYYEKVLDNRITGLGKKNHLVAMIYNEIGDLFCKQQEYEKALYTYQNALYSNVGNFNDTLNIANVPVIKDFKHFNELLKSLQAKAQIFAKYAKNQTAFGTLSGLEIALKHYQACDTLITNYRQTISKQSDKIALGQKADKIYKEAIDVCLKLANSKQSGLDLQSNPVYYRQLAFYFSEKNKSAVLLESLAGKEAQKFVDIPDSLLEMEHNLNIDIAFYNKELAAPQDLDSMHIETYRESLFKTNKTYDSLISVFETQFPEYFNLKYSSKTATVKEIQGLLNKKQAMISYSVDDSAITIFAITKKSFNVFTVSKIHDFDTNLEILRNTMLPTSNADQRQYSRLANSFYNQLFLFLNQNKDFDKIIDLIIIPDGQLSTLPFEALLTNEPSVDLSDLGNYKDLPYLINQFDISYSYSATLFNNTFSKKTVKNRCTSNLIEWIGMAPVFDSESTGGITEYSSKLKKEIQKLNKDSISIRSFFNPDKDYIFPLPGTEKEVKELFRSFESNNKTAEMKLRSDANESFIKSGELSKYKIIHIATHGLVNRDNPELSFILLSQNNDTTIKNPTSDNLNTAQDEGILYQGEILNIKLNADLVVLSACETGLGKITNGEGIIGLTRALLYAGAKNIIVSLWQVSDASTSELMVSFYNHLFQSKSNNFNEALRKAKLQLINQGKFAHPYFWSSFVLIGR